MQLHPLDLRQGWTQRPLPWPCYPTAADIPLIPAGVHSWGTQRGRGPQLVVNVNVNNLPAISIQDFDDSGESGPQAGGLNHLETPLRQLLVTHGASSCAKRGGHVQLLHPCVHPGVHMRHTCAAPD